jgi:hypothetical protein
MRHMKIGSYVIYEGRTYVLRGLDPMSVPDRRADLVDPDSGERIRVPLENLVAAIHPPS